MIIRTKAYPRAGLIGNPSDGYFGKTISFTFSDFHADVTLYQTPEMEVLPSERDHSRFGSIAQLVADVNQYGYYGGIRLLKAAIKRFFDYCIESRIELDDRNFTINYHSDIPHQVGMAGSSAIITAALRALMAFYQISIPKPIQANLVLSVEKDELGISAGLQDRVAQVYEGITFMDFDRALFDRQGYGSYESIAELPPLYIAYRTDLAEGSEVFHNNIRERFEMGDKEVIDAMNLWADLTVRAKEALDVGGEIDALLDENFDQRARLYQLSEGNLNMVKAARSCGASAKFGGSGGAIVGTCRDQAMFDRLAEVFGPMGIEVFRPTIV